MNTQLHISRETGSLREEVRPARNSEQSTYAKKPEYGTGFWTSTWNPVQQTSAWVEWCHANDFDDPYKKSWHLLQPKKTARLYVIDNVLDLADLLKYHSWVPPRFGKTELAMNPIMLRLFRGFDFETLSQFYDGLHLTAQGNDLLHLGHPLDMNAWDCESILWFHWCFSSVERIKTPFAPIDEEEEVS